MSRLNNASKHTIPSNSLRETANGFKNRKIRMDGSKQQTFSTLDRAGDVLEKAANN